MLLTTGLMGLSGLCILISAFKEGGEGFFWMRYLCCLVGIIRLQCFRVWMCFFFGICLSGLLGACGSCCCRESHALCWCSLCCKKLKQIKTSSSHHNDTAKRQTYILSNINNKLRKEDAMITRADKDKSKTLMNLEYSQYFQKNTYISKFMKMFPVGFELFYVEG